MRTTSLAVIVVLLAATCAAAGFSLDIEGGAASSGYNDVRIPGDEGTDVSFTDDLSPDTVPFWRARLSYEFGERHTISALYAPLEITSSGTLDTDVRFEDVTFAEGTQVDAEYVFNSYRLTYRYEFRPGEDLEFGLGFTAKVRDAAVRIEGGGESEEKTNVGLVPLINFRVAWRLTDAITATMEGDALAAPQGRAEDVFVGLGYALSDKVELKAGYRILEGGADNDEVYNFALVNYASLGATISF